jgi:hypothetical protein
LFYIGDAGRHSNGGVLSSSAFGRALESGALSDCPLPGASQPSLPYVIVGNEIFLLRANMLRPYPGRNLQESRAIFNYCFRARGIIHNRQEPDLIAPRKFLH